MPAPFTITSADGATWTGPGTVVIRGASYAVVFSKTGCTGPCVKLIPATGSPTVYEGALVSCGCSYAEFAFAHPAICTGADSGRPCSDGVVVRVDWGCCDPAGWGGAGWYCVREAGGSPAAVAVELADADKCDPTIEIVSGPYPDEATAQGACPPPAIDTVSCCSGTAAENFAFVVPALANLGSCTACPDAAGAVVTVGPVSSLVGTLCQWTGFTPSFGPFCGSQFVVLRRKANGEVTLGVDGVAYRTFYPEWDCRSPLTVFRNVDSSVRCSGWPDAITIYPV